MASPPDPGGVRKPDSTDKSRLVQHDVILPATGALKYFKIKLDLVSVDCKISTEKVVSGFFSRSRWLTHNLVRVNSVRVNSVSIKSARVKSARVNSVRFNSVRVKSGEVSWSLQSY